MNPRVTLRLLSLLLLAPAVRGVDPRDLINSGYVLPNEGYCDQPYIVETKDGNLLCVETTGSGAEGGPENTVPAPSTGSRGAARRRRGSHRCSRRADASMFSTISTAIISPIPIAN